MHSFSCLFSIIMITAVAVNSHKRGARVRRIVGGIPADVPPEDDPTVFTRFAGHAAKVTGVRDFPHYVFRGIRYAHAPKGKDRFQRPRQFFLDGDVNATVYPPPCLQPVVGQNSVIGSEDCLFLNIFTPDLPDGTEGLPVVVWIHGGGFRYGSASQYGVRHLVGKRLVIVTIQYRLGSLGFLSTGTQEMPGNAGLWDMALAVQFVRNYIGFFGGNPHKIVVMGHGTGASSAMLLALSNIAKGIPSGVVAMSGTAVSHGAIDEKPVNSAHEIAENQGCPTTSTLTMIKCLQNTPAANIIKADSELENHRMQTGNFVNGLGGILATAPVSEGGNDYRSLPAIVENPPMEDMMAKRRPDIPLLTGITKDETKRAVHGPYRKEITSKLGAISDFLENAFVQNLQEFIGFNKKTKRQISQLNQTAYSIFQVTDSSQFKNYLKVRKENLNEVLDKVSEATGDALFNLPAFLTSDLWSSDKAPTFLYRFEYSSKSRNAFHFLKGLPLIGNTTTTDDEDDTVSHGDDLGYLFEPCNLDGTPIETDNKFTETDQKVKELFTQMIADFARHGKINVNGKEVPRFSSADNNFIQISDKPKLGTNFRYCEMALWSGLVQRLQSSTCQFFSTVDKQVQNVLGKINTTSIQSALPLAPKKLPMGNPRNPVSNVAKQFALPGIG